MEEERIRELLDQLEQVLGEDTTQFAEKFLRVNNYLEEGDLKLAVASTRGLINAIIVHQVVRDRYDTVKDLCELQVELQTDPAQLASIYEKLSQLILEPLARDLVDELDLSYHKLSMGYGEQARSGYREIGQTHKVIELNQAIDQRMRYIRQAEPFDLDLIQPKLELILQAVGEKMPDLPSLVEDTGRTGEFPMDCLKLFRNHLQPEDATGRDAIARFVVQVLPQARQPPQDDSGEFYQHLYTYTTILVFQYLASLEDTESSSTSILQFRLNMATTLFYDPIINNTRLKMGIALGLLHIERIQLDNEAKYRAYAQISHFVSDLHVLKGDLSRAVEVTERALQLYLSQDHPSYVSPAYFQIIYLLVLQVTRRRGFIEPDAPESYTLLERLEEFGQFVKSTGTSQELYDLVSALVTKFHPRLADKVQAMELLHQAVRSPIDLEYRMIALKHYLELLLQEYQLTGYPPVLAEIEQAFATYQENKTTETNKIDQKRYDIEFWMLQANFLLVKGEIAQSQELIEKGLAQAREGGIYYMVPELERFQNQVRDRFSEYENLLRSDTSLVHQFETMRIMEYVKRVQTLGIDQLGDE